MLSLVSSLLRLPLRRCCFLSVWMASSTSSAYPRISVKAQGCSFGFIVLDGLFGYKLNKNVGVSLFLGIYFLFLELF